MNNVLTASRMNCLMRCPRQHFWQYEIGLVRESSTIALRIGSAWARAMKARWNGLDYDGALAVAIPDGIDLDPYACATVSALLAGYYDYYGPRENVGSLIPELQFKRDISHLHGLSQQWTVEGKIDGIGSLKDGRTVLIESKTTGDSIAYDSDYWLRLRFNLQVLNYVAEASALGWEISEVYYDVTRKPAIRPKEICDLDTQGKKIVLDQNGKRVFLAKGKPKQSASEGQTVKSHIETPDEFSDRLWKDTQARPEFYFARREIPILHDQLLAFGRQRLAIIHAIEGYRDHENNEIPKESWQDESIELIAELFCDCDAWPRAVREDNCSFCPYKEFCLQDIKPDLNHPPSGFTIKPFNPELENEPTETQSPSPV